MTMRSRDPMSPLDSGLPFWMSFSPQTNSPSTTSWMSPSVVVLLLLPRQGSNIFTHKVFFIYFFQSESFFRWQWQSTYCCQLELQHWKRCFKWIFGASEELPQGDDKEEEWRSTCAWNSKEGKARFKTRPDCTIHGTQTSCPTPSCICQWWLWNVPKISNVHADAKGSSKWRQTFLWCPQGLCKLVLIWQVQLISRTPSK